MKQCIYEIIENISLTDVVYKMVLKGDTCAIKNSGEFINIKIEGFFLRRPISICDYDDETITILYKIVGSGTEKMKAMASGDMLDVLTGLGNGYNTEKSGERPLLIGGGVGIPPLYRLAKNLLSLGKTPIVILGFQTKDEMFFYEEFKALGADVFVATADGSFGKKGLVTDVISEINDYTYFYTCGPEPMLKAICKSTNSSGQLSFEERMGCGFGACMGCSCQTKYGNKRICKEGPVLEKEEIIW